LSGLHGFGWIGLLPGSNCGWLRPSSADCGNAAQKYRDGVLCLGVNTLLSNLKTAITGTYHGFKFEKYAYRYLAETQYRFNRRFDLSTMLPRLLYAGARTGSRPEKWLRLAEA